MSYERTDTPNADGTTTVRIIASDDHSWTPQWYEATPSAPPGTGIPAYALYGYLPSDPVGPLGGWLVNGTRYQKALFLEHPIAGDFTGAAPVGLTPRFILPTMVT